MEKLSESQYKHVGKLPLQWIKNTDENFTAKLNDLTVANMTIEGTEGGGRRYKVFFVNIPGEDGTYYDRKETDMQVRFACWDWLMNTIQPVWDAGTTAMLKQPVMQQLINDLGLTDMRNEISGRPISNDEHKTA